MSHASTAARMRAAKEQHPERYCAEPSCLWRTEDTYCPRHAAHCADCGKAVSLFAHTERGVVCDDCVKREDPTPEAIARQEQQDWDGSRGVGE